MSQAFHCHACAQPLTEDELWGSYYDPLCEHCFNESKRIQRRPGVGIWLMAAVLIYAIITALMAVSDLWGAGV